MAPAQTADLTENGHVGPHPSFIQLAKPYIFEQRLQECLKETGVTEAKEDSIRLQGVAYIDSVRKALRLPIRTFNTAVMYFHRFRLVHTDLEYVYIDAAAAALFTACKIEDTLKKSKEILCAAYNLKLPSAEHLNPDDPMFEIPSRGIVGLERLMLEASGFDFRSRPTSNTLIKIAKYYQVDRTTVGRTAYNMSLDLYRTFAPLKQTISTMAIACVELSGRLHKNNVSELEAGKGYRRWQTSRPEVMETLLDLLDLYTHHRNSTTVGLEHAIDTFIGIRITLNGEAASNDYPRFTNSLKKNSITNGIKSTNGSKDIKTSKSPASPQDPTSADGRTTSEISSPNTTVPKGRAGVKEGTIRFMLDAERAKDEKKVVEEYFKVEEEEYEVEVEGRRRRSRGY